MQKNSQVTFNEIAAVLDPEALERLREVDEDGALLRTLLAMYAEKVPTGLDDLRAALASGNHEVIRKSAHVLRSSNLNIGARTVGDILFNIEQRSRDQQVISETEALRLLETLQTEIQAAHDAFAVYVADYSSRTR